MLFFIIGLFCELDRLNGKKTLKNLFAIFYYYFHWLVGFSIAVLCCTLQLILILIACLNISYAKNIRDNSFSGIIPKHWPIYQIISLVSYSPYKHEPCPAKSVSISTPKLYTSAFSIKQPIRTYSGITYPCFPRIDMESEKSINLATLFLQFLFNFLLQLMFCSSFNFPFPITFSQK